MADIIDELLGCSDNELMQKSGLDVRFQKLKDSLAEANKFSGELRQELADEIEEMIAPRLSGESLEWRIEDAQRKQERQARTNKAVMNDSDPESIIDDLEGC